MESRKISVLAAFSSAFSTFFTHIWLYLQFAAVVCVVTISSIIIKNMLEASAFIPSGHLDLLSVVTFEYIFKAWCWGACTIIALQLTRTGHITRADLINSIQYIPQFFIITLILYIPAGLLQYIVGFLFPVLSTTRSIFLLVCSIPALIWRLYGQFTVPLFMMEKKDILTSLNASIHMVHQLLWRVIGLLALYCNLILIGIIVGYLTIIIPIISQSPFTIAVANELFNLAFFYPLLALSYVYLCERAKEKAV